MQEKPGTQSDGTGCYFEDSEGVGEAAGKELSSVEVVNRLL